MNLNELPQYKCHKVVRAAKITGVEPGGLAVIVDLGKVSASIDVPEGWVAKHNPLQGDGYLVAYEDGYLSWSPAEAFEAGYHRIPELGIACGVKGELYPCKPDIFAATYDPVGVQDEINRRAVNALNAITGDGIDLSAADFSDALMWLKEGKRVQRAGWNGAGQWVVLIDPGNAMYTKGGASAPMQPCLGLKNAQGNMQPGWVPSMGDLMAEDWQVVSD